MRSFPFTGTSCYRNIIADLFVVNTDVRKALNTFNRLILLQTHTCLQKVRLRWDPWLAEGKVSGKLSTRLFSSRKLSIRLIQCLCALAQLTDQALQCMPCSPFHTASFLRAGGERGWRTAHFPLTAVWTALQTVCSGGAGLSLSDLTR